MQGEEIFSRIWEKPMRETFSSCPHRKEESGRWESFLNSGFRRKKIVFSFEQSARTFYAITQFITQKKSAWEVVACMQTRCVGCITARHFFVHAPSRAFPQKRVWVRYGRMTFKMCTGWERKKWRFTREGRERNKGPSLQEKPFSCGHRSNPFPAKKERISYFALLQNRGKTSCFNFFRAPRLARTTATQCCWTLRVSTTSSSTRGARGSRSHSCTTW